MEIGIGQVDLTDAVHRAFAIDVDQKSEVKTPIRVDPHDTSQVTGHRDFTREWVTEAAQVRKERHVAYRCLDGLQKRSDEQPCGTSIDTVAHPAVVPFAEAVIAVGIGNGIAEPRNDFAIVSDDIAVVQRDEIVLLFGQNISERHPHSPALARRPDGEPVLLQEILEVTDSLARIPHDPDLLGQVREEFGRPVESRTIGFTKGDHYLMQVTRVLEIPHNPLHSVLFHIAVEGRDYQTDRTLRGELGKLTLDVIETVGVESMESRYDSGLVKITHRRSRE